MKKWVGVLSLCLAMLFGVQMSVWAAPSEVKLTPQQMKEVQLKKLETKKAGQLKKLDLSQKEKVLKAKGLRSDQLVTMQSSAVGTYGDILVTTSGTSSSSFAWAGGHAAVVSNDSQYTVESFGNKGDLNGVRIWPNDWGTRYDMVRGLWVSGADGAAYQYVANYAEAQVGKPYNYNFFDVTTTSSFYCSQLVWRAWYNATGIDLNDGGAVWPVDLIESPYTIVFYSKG